MPIYVSWSDLAKEALSLSSVLITRLIINLHDHSILDHSDVQKTTVAVGPFVTTVVDREGSGIMVSFATSDSGSYMLVF